MQCLVGIVLEVVIESWRLGLGQVGGSAYLGLGL